jgi:GNAT superfamily N-acetyltransferase
VAAVMRLSVRGLARGAYRPRQLARWSSLPPLYHAWAMTAGGEAYLLAERRGRLLGYAALRGREVTAIFVRPSAARRGLGAALLGRLERLATRAGRRSLVVKAALPALPFYAALGFRGTRRLRVPLPGGGALAARALSKRIGA